MRDRSPFRGVAFASPSVSLASQRSFMSSRNKGSQDYQGLSIRSLEEPLLDRPLLERGRKSTSPESPPPVVVERDRAVSPPEECIEGGLGSPESRDDGDVIGIDNGGSWLNMMTVLASEKRRSFFAKRRSLSVGVPGWRGLDSTTFAALDPQPDVKRHASMQSMHEAEMEMVSAVERFSRLSTELANERTLLAWVRTCLAAVRTALAYVGMAAATGDWWISVRVAQWGMCALIILAALAGSSRYYRLKAILNFKTPPRQFGRISVAPMNAVVVIATFATAAGLLAGTWHKG